MKMKEEFHKRLDASIDKLKEILSRCDTESIIGYIAASIVTNGTDDLI